MTQYKYRPIVLPDGEVKIVQVAIMPVSEDFTSVGEYSDALQEFIRMSDNPVLFSCVNGERVFFLNNLERVFTEDEIYFQSRDRDYPLSIKKRLEKGVGPELFIGYRVLKSDQRLAIETIYNMLINGRSDLDGTMRAIMETYRFIKFK